MSEKDWLQITLYILKRNQNHENSNLHFFFCQHKTKEYPMRHMHFNCSWQTCNKWPLWAKFERNIDWIHYLYHTLSVVSKKRFCSKGRQIILLREKWIKIWDLTKDISESIYIHLFQSLNSFIKWICKCSFTFRITSKTWRMYYFGIRTNFSTVIYYFLMFLCIFHWIYKLKYITYLKLNLGLF